MRGFIRHEPLWIVRPLGLDRVRKQAETMEFEARRFYERAVARASDAGVRKLLGDLAEAERSHITLAQRLGAQHLTPSAQQAEEETRRRMFVLQIVQPGLAGLMDGSVSTLAPLFAAAFATHAHLADVPGRHGGLRGRRHLHGLCRGAVRRRRADGPRPSPGCAASSPG